MDYSKEAQLKKNVDEKQKEVRFRACRYCKEKTVPYGSINPFCFENKCIRKHNEVTQASKKRKEKQEHNKNDNKWLIKEAQKVFNRYIRKRDERLPCVSCGYVFSYLEGEPQGEGRQRQAGHLKTEAKNSLLRFHEDNVWSQCNHCNDPTWGLKGNVGEYEKNLRVKIGDDRVDVLFQPKIEKKWTNIELQDIIEKYKEKIKELI